MTGFASRLAAFTTSPAGGADAVSLGDGPGHVESPEPQDGVMSGEAGSERSWVAPRPPVNGRWAHWDVACGTGAAAPTPAGVEVRTCASFGPLPPAAALEPLVDGPVHRAIYLDLETTGLDVPGAMPFVVGCLERAEGLAEATTFVLWDPSDEAAMLEAVVAYLAARAGRGALLVTFNGLRFDVPLLRGRCRRLGVAEPPEMDHLDVLPHARRLLRYDVPRRNLSALERHLLGHRRSGDLAGARVPAAHAAYLEAPGPETRHGVERVVAHNLSDLVGLARVGAEVARIEEAPVTLGQAVGVARRALRRGHAHRALGALAPRFFAEADRAARLRPELAADAAFVLVRAYLATGRGKDVVEARRIAAWARRHVPFDPRPARLAERAGRSL